MKFVFFHNFYGVKSFLVPEIEQMWT